MIPDTSASSCKHQKSHHPRRPRKARTASENKKIASNTFSSLAHVLLPKHGGGTWVVWKETNTLCIV
jgi:hypothetical protein